MQTSVQINCPFCNAAQEPNATGNYVCAFCLQPFSVVDAERETSRLLEEIRAWVEQKVGSAAAGASGADASSRAFIFQQRIFPDLRRDIDRSIEMLGTFGQFPLVLPPIRVPTRGNAMPNPLVARRRQILGLKGLRARLTSEQVTAFAVRDSDRVAVQGLDRRLASLIHLSNVADAAARLSPDGYQAARRNIETLVEELAKSLALEGAHDPSLRAFIAGLQQRYQALAELCQICEELSSPNAVAGAPLADRAEACARGLGAVAQQIEASNFSPADSMPVVVGVNQEAMGCWTLARWLRMYDVIAGGSGVPFIPFAREMDALTSGGQAPPEYQLDLLEAFASTLSVARGRTAAIVVTDFSWVGQWAEGMREKRSLGMFGVEEQVARVDQFLCPAWIAEVTFSRASGAIFTAGHEGRALCLVDAFAPHPSKVVILDPAMPLARALGQQQVATTSAIGMPRSTHVSVQPMIMEALRYRPDLLNANARVRGLAFLPAAIVHFTAGQRSRSAAACVGGAVAIEPAAQASVAFTQQLLQRFGQ